MNPVRCYNQLTARLDAAGNWLWPLALRAILFWEFWDSGITKYRGSNWFGSIQQDFPWPFRAFGPELNWFAATWGELVFAVLLLVGLFTRFAAFSLIIITVVATAAIHWPDGWDSLAELWRGYAIGDKGYGNYKLPLLFVLMLLPLVYRGAGRFSLDALLLGLVRRPCASPPVIPDLATFAWVLLIPGLALLLLMPITGAVLLVGSVTLLLVHRQGRSQP
jgi:putative oxidoreductase